MEHKELLTLAGRLKLPEAVLVPLAAAAKALPEGLPVGQLAEPEIAAAACQTEERYCRDGIPVGISPWRSCRSIPASSGQQRLTWPLGDVWVWQGVS